MNGRRLQTILT